MKFRALVALLFSFSAACALPEAPLELTPRSCGVAADLPFPMKWMAPAGPAALQASRAWCAPLGPVAAGLAPIPGGSPARNVLVISWNVAVGAGDVEAFVRDVTNDEIRSGRGRPAFVLLLQEAYRTGTSVPSSIEAAARIARRIAHGRREGRDVESLARRLGMHFIYVPSMRNGGVVDGTPGEDRGNAILTTLPVRDAVAIELPFELQRRVAISATLDLDRAPLTVVSVHLDTRRALSQGSIFSGPLARQRQAAALVRALEAARAAGPIVVAGDFNTLAGAREPAIRAMEQRFTRARCGSAVTHEWGLSLDYVFASDAALLAGCDRSARRFESDHHPLVARLKL